MFITKEAEAAKIDPAAVLPKTTNPGQENMPAEKKSDDDEGEGEGDKDNGET